MIQYNQSISCSSVRNISVKISWKQGKEGSPVHYTISFLRQKHAAGNRVLPKEGQAEMQKRQFTPSLAQVVHMWTYTFLSLLPRLAPSSPQSCTISCATAAVLEEWTAVQFWSLLLWKQESKCHVWGCPPDNEGESWALSLPLHAPLPRFGALSYKSTVNTKRSEKVEAEKGGSGKGGEPGGVQVTSDLNTWRLTGIVSDRQCLFSCGPQGIYWFPWEVWAAWSDFILGHPLA